MKVKLNNKKWFNLMNNKKVQVKYIHLKTKPLQEV